MNTLPATVVGPLSKDNTQNVVLRTVGGCNPSSFINELDYVFRNSASAAFCVLTMCFKDMDVEGAHRTITYNLLTSLTKIVTTVAVTCLFFKWRSPASLREWSLGSNTDPVWRLAFGVGGGGNGFGVAHGECHRL